MKNDELYLHHILDAIHQIEAYIVGVDEADFVANRLIQDAVTRRLEIIGEASRRLSDSFRAAHASIPWASIIGMRHRIAHDYLNIDVQIIWEVVQHDLPVLKSYLAGLL